MKTYRQLKVWLDTRLTDKQLDLDITVQTTDYEYFGVSKLGVVNSKDTSELDSGHPIIIIKGDNL